jgi:hypothetical protein
MYRSRLASMTVSMSVSRQGRNRDEIVGERNWYLPRWLRRMPKLGRRPVEPPGHSSADSSRVFLA